MAAEHSQGQARVSLRLPADHFEILEQRATEEDRTVSAEIRRLIRRYVTEVREAAAT
ncbi:MAG: ribbon-helix-helix protein, CopG family [Solirubrobacterales bacterium]